MKKPRILFTGSAGFLGQAMYKAFEGDYALRLCDIADFDAGLHEKVVGDVSDPVFCDVAVKDCDAMVIAHMFPRPNDTPYGPFNANVTGTANLMYAAQRANLQRLCVISSVDAVIGNPPEIPRSLTSPLKGRDIYSATKACQEVVARSVYAEHRIPCAVLRIGYVVDLDQMTDKYDHALAAPEPGMIDRHDCGVACRKALEKEDLSYDVFYVFSICDVNHCPEGLATHRALDWVPAHAPAGAKA